MPFGFKDRKKTRNGSYPEDISVVPDRKSDKHAPTPDEADTKNPEKEP